jgi:hypothetical protein
MGWLNPCATTCASATSTAPMGTSPMCSAVRACSMAWRMNASWKGMARGCSRARPAALSRRVWLIRAADAKGDGGRA